MKNEQGMILVLAIFMLALLSMIGMSALMTSTVEMNITGNERSHRILFYEAESCLTLASEIIEQNQGYSTSLESLFLSNTNYKISDTGFLLEANDVTGTSDIWTKDNQLDELNWGEEADDPCEECDLEFLGGINAIVDVDRVKTSHLAGSGAEFGAGDEGAASAMEAILFNIDCESRYGTGRTEHIQGFQLIPRK